MKSLWIDLFIPVNSTICNLYLHLEILPQSCVKFHFFSFWEEKKGTVFVWKIQLFFCKSCIFPIIFDIFPLWEKYIPFWKITQKVYMKTVPFSPYFFTFYLPFTPFGWNPTKIHQNSLDFFCLADQYIGFWIKWFFLMKKNHCFQNPWDWRHLPSNNEKPASPGK